MVFLVVSECSHYKRVRCENVERQGEAAGGLAKCEKGKQSHFALYYWQATSITGSQALLQTDWHASAPQL